MRPADQNLFTKKITRKPPSIRGGRDNAFTIVEFSLTNDCRDKLKLALDEYIKDGQEDIEQLISIIERQMPQGILHELKTLYRKNGASNTVFSIHNLPELSPEEIIKTIDRKRLHQGNHWQEQISKHCYSPYILIGLFEAIGLNATSHETHPLLRARERYPIGYPGTGGLHKDRSEINGLGGIISDTSKTRFTDWEAVLNDVERHGGRFNYFSPGRAVLKVKTDCTPSGRHLEYIKVPASQFRKTFPNWRESIGMGINNIEPASDIRGNEESAQNLQKIIDRHSFDLEAKPGSILLWNNAGALFHTGNYPEHLPKGYSVGDVTITRVAIPHLAMRMR